MNVQLRSVTDDEGEIRLDRWFRRHFPNLTQGAIQKLCRTGQIRVDGKRAEANQRQEDGEARPLASTAQAMRASLLASAIASTLWCNRLLAASIQDLSP